MNALEAACSIIFSLQANTILQDNIQKKLKAAQEEEDVYVGYSCFLFLEDADFSNLFVIQ